MTSREGDASGPGPHIGPPPPPTTRSVPSTATLESVLTRRPLTAVEWGLDRTREMLRRLGDPHRSFRSVHVGGTNGKGSTAAVVASVLQAAGRRTGLYTSPELLELRDRYRVGGEPLPGPFLDACAARVGPVAAESDATFFEAATALAFLAFREAGVEWAAVEVGLGGRLDATNVLAPAVTIVTTVSMEHAEHLGDTLEEVAAEKAGILKPGVPAVLGPLGQPALGVVEARAREVGAPVALLGREARVDEVAVELRGTSFSYTSPRFPRGRRFRVPLPGRHQAVNAALALLALERLEEDLPEEALEEGVAGVSWRGRFEHVRSRGGNWVLDAGHNREGVAALADTLDRVRLPGPTVLLAAALVDKDPIMLRPLLSRTEGVVLTSAPSAPEGRRWDPASAAAGLGGGGRAVEVVEDFGEAMARARELADGGTVVVTGSCYTVGDALRRLEPEGVRA